MNEKTDTLRKMQEKVATITENYFELKGKFECKRCSKKIPSNFDLLVSLRFIPSEDGILCNDCLRKYIYELEKSESEK